MPNCVLYTFSDKTTRDHKKIKHGQLLFDLFCIVCLNTLEEASEATSFRTNYTKNTGLIYFIYYMSQNYMY